MRGSVLIAIMGLALCAPATVVAQVQGPMQTIAPARPLTILAPEAGLRLGAGLRLRFDWGSRLALGTGSMMTTHLRSRLATAMIDFYPMGDRGFHLSAGTRFLVRRDFAAEADNATRGLLYRPRWGGAGLRTGMRKFSPTATIGYTAGLATGLSLGIEAGAGLGRAFNGMPSLRSARSFQRLGASHGERPADKVNPLLSATLGFRF